MHRLPVLIAVAIFDRPNTVRLLQATRYLDGHLTFRSSSVTPVDTPLLTDRLGLPSNALVFTRGSLNSDGRDLRWQAPDAGGEWIDLRIDEPVIRLIGIAAGKLLLAGHRDHALPALVMGVALSRLALTLRLPCLEDAGIADLLNWLPARPLPPAPRPRPTPPTTMALAFANATARQKGR